MNFLPVQSPSKTEEERAIKELRIVKPPTAGWWRGNWPEGAGCAGLAAHITGSGEGQGSQGAQLELTQSSTLDNGRRATTGRE